MKILNKLAMATAFAALTSGAAFAQTYTTTNTNVNTTTAYTKTAANAQSEIRLNSTQVRNLQQALRSAGYNIAVDGLYGPNTASALRSYQSANGLAVTGQANRETLAEMNLNTDAFFNSNYASANTNAQSALRLSRAEVRDMQQALRAQGYSIGVDGLYGPNTASALRSFQASNNLAVTGQANSETLAELNINAYSNVASNPNVNAQTALRLSRAEVRDLQQTLRAAGYSIGVDGLYGPNTASALRSYQASNNLAVTGQANRETLAHMNLISGGTTNTATNTTTTTNADIQAQTALQLDSNEIRSMQQALRNQGYNIAVNGIADQDTVSALRLYQAKNNLSVTGRANFETLANLDLLDRTNSNTWASGSATTAAAIASLLPSNMSVDSNDIRMLQQALRSEGYNIGIDGIVGQNTINALRTYQASNNLNASGQLDQDTLVMLNLWDSFRR